MSDLRGLTIGITLFAITAAVGGLLVWNAWDVGLARGQRRSRRWVPVAIVVVPAVAVATAFAIDAMAT